MEAVQVVLQEVQVAEAVHVHLVVPTQLALELVQLVSERRAVRLVREGGGCVGGCCTSSSATQPRSAIMGAIYVVPKTGMLLL